MIKGIYRDFIYVSFAVMMVGCTMDKPGPEGLTKASFGGEWIMNTAYKDGKETKLLDNAFFRFDSLGNFSTNIQGDDTAYPFKLSGNSVQIEGAKPNKYSVLELTQDTLIMETRLRNFDFKFVTLKKRPSDIQK